MKEGSPALLIRLTLVNQSGRTRRIRFIETTPASYRMIARHDNITYFCDSETDADHRMAMTVFSYSNKPAELVLEFESNLSGRLQLLAALEVRPGGGVFSTEFNGVPLKNKLSTLSAKEREVRIVNLGEVIVKPGKQEIRILWAGDRDLKLSMDYFELLPK